jgi:hypothetical protein
MSLVKSLTAAVVLGAAASAATAAIVPTWRVNNIPTAATNADPNLNGAISVSLMVTLSGGSQYNVSGLNINQSTFGGAPFTVYNTPGAQFGSDNAPNPAFFAIFPQVEYDTYVTTTNGAAGSSAAIPGTYSGAPGPAVFGPDRVDVAWGATPNTGSNGTFEIARVTLKGPFIPGSTPVSGEVRDSLNPNTAVPVPAFPFAIPEPTTLGLAALGLGLMGLRRR